MAIDYASQLLSQGQPDNAGPARMGLFKTDPAVEAVISKLVANNNNPVISKSLDERLRSQVTGPDMTLMDRISDKTATDIIDAQSIFQLSPEIETAKEIMVSSVLSPKDLSDSALTYSVEPGVIPAELVTPMTEVIRDHFENNYKMSEKNPDILRDTLFMTGSYPLLVLPETSIDFAINSTSRVSAEAFGKIVDSTTKMPVHTGILGNAPTKADADNEPSLESLFDKLSTSQSVGPYNPSFETIEIEYPVMHPEKPADANGPRKPAERELVKLNINTRLTIVDNPQILRVPDLLEKMRRDRLNDKLKPAGLSSEAFTGTDPNLNKRGMVQSGPIVPKDADALQQSKERASLYRQRQFQPNQTLSISKPSALNRESVGHPLVMALPSECVIPVHVPSSPEKHLGYFILLDRQGNPLVKTSESDYFNEMSSNLKMNRELSSQLTAATKRATTGVDWYSRQLDVDEMTRLYSDIVEVELSQRLKHGLYGDGVKVSKPQEVYRIMLARALANMHTQLLYVPAELLTYFAFEYNQYGIGVSLLQKAKIIASLRSMLLLADMMGAIKNSVGNTIVSVELDQEDPDPVATVETIMHEFAYGRSNGMMPLGATNPRDIVNYMFQASVQYVVSGNPRYPTTKISAEDRQNNRVRPDDKLMEDLKKRLLLALGVPPESVDAANGPEFARSVTEGSLIFARRVLMIQRKFTGFVQEFMARYTLNSGILMDRLREIINESGVDLSKDERSESAVDLDDKQVDSYVQRPVKDQDQVDALIVDFVYALRVSLPKPDQGTSKAQLEAFTAYSEGLDKALSAYIDGSFFTKLELADTEENRDAIIGGIKARFLRGYLRANNLYTELEALVDTAESEESQGIGNELAAHVDAIRAVVGEYMDKETADLKAWNAKVEAAKVKGGLSGGDGYAASPTTVIDGGGGDTGSDTPADDGGDGSLSVDIDETSTTTTTTDEPAADDADADAGDGADTNPPA